jgi:hypothetical protein
MKLNRSLFITCIAIVSLGCNSTPNNPNSKTDQIITYENIAEKDTLVVDREFQEANINMVFPAGGSETELFLYDSTTFKKLSYTPNDSSLKFLRADKVAHLERLPTLNIKGLTDGLYGLNMHADFYGGVKWVLIQTKK